MAITGYDTIADASSKNWPIGAIGTWYGNIWVFGTPRQPFVARISGLSPDEYSADVMLQDVSAHYKTVITSLDDLHFLYEGGVASISSLQEYKDLKSSTHTQDIIDIIHQYFSDGAFAGYDPKNGIYLLKLEGYTYTIAVHMRLKTIKRLGERQVAVAPVSLFDFAFSGAETAYGTGNGFAYVGTDAGKVYKFDESVVDDADVAVTYQIDTHTHSTRLGELNAMRVTPDVYCDGAASFVITYYKNHSSSALTTTSFTLPADMSDFHDRAKVNFNFRDVKTRIGTIVLTGGEPLVVKNVVLACKIIGGF